MSNHVTEWLNAYLDDELKGGRLHQVQSHLAECQECQAELKSLQSLSSLLRDGPVPEFISSERFAAQVSLRLPHKQPVLKKRSALEVGWWLIPVGLLILWVFINTSALVSRVAATANEFGLLRAAPAWLVVDSSQGASWSETLGEFGLLNGNSLEWAEFTETFTRNKLPLIIWQASIAMLYLSWIAILWARHTPPQQGQFLKS